MTTGIAALDLLVIGAGPGGYVAAIKAAKLGLRTAICEREVLGGVCLNWGCIPSKAVIQAAKAAEQARKSERMGVLVRDVSIDIARMVEWKDQIVQRLTGGIGQLLKGNGVRVIRGEARFTSPGTVVVSGADGAAEELAPRKVIVATGARPVELPGLAFDGERVVGARGLLAQRTLPRRLLVVGGGVIGLELGTAFAKLGSEVTVVELLDSLLPEVDRDLVRWVERRLKRLKVKVHLRSKVCGYEEAAGELHVAVTDAEGRDPQTLVCDRILSAVGFRPNTEGLGLEAAGVRPDLRGHIPVDEACRTEASHIFAIGDVTGPPYLAHRASKQGIVAAEVAAGRASAYDVRALPAAMFTDPELATVGLTEATAAEQGYRVRVGRFPFAALGRAQALGIAPVPGLVKLVSCAETGLVLGAGICGPNASDLIAEVALAIEMGALAEDLAATVHAHPTFPEAIMEAAEAAAHGSAIHAL